jgi:hypothetical protein
LKVKRLRRAAAEARVLAALDLDSGQAHAPVNSIPYIYRSN